MGSVVVWWLALLCGCSKLASGVSEVSNSWDSFQDPCGEIKLDKLTILFLNRLMDTLQNRYLDLLLLSAAPIRA